MDSKYEELYNEYHSLLMETERVMAQIVMDLDRDGTEFGLKELADAKFVLLHKDLYERSAEATRKLQVYMGKCNEQQVESMRIMAEASQSSMDREKRYEKLYLEKFRPELTDEAAGGSDA